MKIGQKLILGFIGIALLTGLVGYIGFMGSQEIFKVFDAIADETAPELIALGKIDAFSSRMQTEAVSFALLNTETEIAAGELEEFKEVSEGLNRAIAELEEIAFAEEVIEKIKEARTNLYNYSLVLINAKKSGKDGLEIFDSQKELEEIGDEFDDFITTHLSSKIEYLKRQDMLADKVAGRTASLIIIVTVFVIFLAVVLGYFIARTISRPIIQLKDASLKIGEGKFNTKVDINSKDEIGVLAKSFNKMASDLSGAIEKEKKLIAITVAADAEKKKAEELAGVNEELVYTNEKIKQSNEELISAMEEIRKVNEEIKKAKKEAENKATQLQKLVNVVVGRELRMRELKGQVNSLLKELGRPQRYGKEEKSDSPKSV